MNLKLLLFLTACLYLSVPAAGLNLLAATAAVKGAILGAGLTGVALSSSGGSNTVVIQGKPGVIAVESVPAQQVVVQQPVVEYKPAHSVTLIPVATVSSSYSFTDKLSRLWGGISSAINTKTRAVGDFLGSLRGPPQIVLIHVNTTSTSTTSSTTTTTTTTKKPTTTTTTHKPHVAYEIVAVAEEGYYRLRPPVAVSEDCDKK